MYSVVSLNKGESAAFTHSTFFDIILGWNECRGHFRKSIKEDLDLCVFFKTKDGEVGGVFSNEYRNKKSDLGNLFAFPYIYLMGEDRPHLKYNNEEIIRVDNLRQMKEVYVVVIDYGKAINNSSNDYQTPLVLELVGTNPLLSLKYIPQETVKGIICVLAIMKENGNGILTMTNISESMTIEEAFNVVPGFNIIVNK